MPLVKSVLVDKLRTFMDASYAPPFTDFPETVEDAQAAFAEAIDAYASSVTPAVLPPVLLSAKNTMATVSLMGMGEFEKGIDVIKSALNIYATQIATGMVGYVPAATPPPDLPRLQDIELSDDPNSDSDNVTAEDVANQLADIIDAWFKQWKSTQSATPFAITPWS